MDERAGWIDQQSRGAAGPLDTYSFLMDQSCSAHTARYLRAALCNVYTGKGDYAASRPVNTHTVHSSYE